MKPWNLIPIGKAVLCGAVLLFFMNGCNGGDPSPSDSPPGKPVIVTTTGMVTDLVEHIVGDDAEVMGLLGVGVDPHAYHPTATDIRKLSDADVVIYSGLMLEGHMAEVFESMADDKPVFAVTDGLFREQLILPGGAESHPDPHVWNDLELWCECVQFTALSLGAVDPSHAPDYEARAQAYIDELIQLDAYVEQVIASIPEDQRYLVTAHDAFSYFERAYDIPVRSVQGITTTSEPATADINDLVQFLVENKVPAVFVETSVSDRGLNAVREGAASQGWEVSADVALFSDAMGEAGTYEGTFIGMFDHNATRIAQELGGEAPAGGYQGMLEGVRQ